MKTIRQFATLSALAAMTLAACAQVPSLVPVPFGQVYAGIAPGGTATACSSTTDIPTTTGTHTGDGCLATQATLLTPYSATVDALGNVYIGDYGDYALRVVYQGGSALAAAIVAANPAVANLVPTPGHIYTLAGSRTAAIATSGSPKMYYCNGSGAGQIALISNGDNCPATYAYIKPRTITLDHDGNIFFTSASGSAPVRVVYVGGTAAANLIKTLNGGTTPQVGFIYSIVKSTANGYNGDGGLATASTVSTYSPRDVAVDTNENVFLSDGTNSFTAPNYASNNNIRRIDGTTGFISTFAGAPGCAQGTTTGCAGVFGGDGGPASAASFNSPYAIFLDANNNLYIADYNDGRIRVVYNSGTVPGLSNLTPGNVYTVVGGGTSTTSGTPATQVMFTTLFNAGMDAGGNIYAQDGTTKSLWKINAKTGIAVIVGNITPTTTAGKSCGTGTGLVATDNLGSGCPATEEAFSASGRLSFDVNGNFYEDESSNAVIRKFSYNTVFPATGAGIAATQPLAYVSPGGTTIASESFTGGDFAASGTPNCAAGAVVAAATTCVFPVTFMAARSGLREGSVTLNSTTAVSTLLSGTGTAANASVDPASSLAVGSGLKPSGVATDLLGNVYVADATSGKVFSAPVGGGTLTAAVSGLSNPAQVAVDGKGGIYVADTGNNRVAYVAGSGGTVAALGSGFSGPKGIVVDGQGNVFVADTGNNRIVELPAIGGQITLNVTGLSGPTGVALDPAGDLFIADTGNNRVVELPFNNAQTVVNLGTTVITPKGVAVDPAGDLYIADAASLDVLEFPAGSTLSNQLVTGLKTPNGLAIDAGGSLYVSDASSAGVLAYNRAVPKIAYSPTNVGQSNIASIGVTNTGNAALTFNGTQLTSATGNTTSFSISAAQSNGCALNTPLALGAQCALTATFSPVAKNPSLTETASLITNASSFETSGAVLTGAGVQLISTTSTLAVTSPTTTPIYYAQSVTVTATITPASSAGAPPTGNINFSVDGKTQPTQTLTGTTALVTLSLGVGTHAVTVSYTGDANYASSSSTLSFTIAKAATTTSLTLAPATALGVTSLTFTAKVASTTATGATGTVTFYAGTTAISTQTLGTSGTVVYTTATTNYGSYQFSAVYSGDANFATSTSTTVAPAPDFSEAPTLPTVGIAQGGVATATINFTPLYNYTGTIHGSCSGLPANSVCSFEPSTLTLSGGVTQNLQLLIYTNVSSTIARNEMPSPRGRSVVVLALLLPLALLARRRRMPRLLLAVLALGVLGGCQSAGNFFTPITPTGSASVVVTFADAAGNSHSQTLTFTVYAD